MRILALQRQDTAVGYYRTRVRARMLKRLGHEVTYWEGGHYREHLVPEKKVPPEYRVGQWLNEHLGKFDLLITDIAERREEWGMFSGFRHWCKGCRMIVDFDDHFTAVPSWNQAAGSWQPGQERYEAALAHLRVAEMTTTSTEYLAEIYGDRTHRVRVLPNLVDPADWEDLPVDPDRKKDPYLRVLYGGAAGHYGDLDAVRESLERAIRFPQVPFRLVCFGWLPHWLQNLSREFPRQVVGTGWIPFEYYPRVIAWGGFDLAIAPLAKHPFNEAKSDIKWTESAIQGIPFMGSNVGPYRGLPQGTAIRVEDDEWDEALVQVLKDPGLRESLRERAGEAVRDCRVLDTGLERLETVIEEAARAPRIETLEDTRLASDRPADQLDAAPAEGHLENPEKAASVEGSQDDRPADPNPTEHRDHPTAR